MSGIVGVIANDSARYSLFASCIDRLILPEGWRKEWLIGGDWCGARNELCRLVLEDEEAEYLWFMDDDHAFPPSLLTRLLAHDEALVTPVCLTRVHPFAPVAYTKKIGELQYLPIPLSESGTNGLVEIEAGGCAGMLIRRDVIEAIEPPWFEYTDRSEDIIFCEKAKAAGFTLHVDLGCTLGHITTAVVHPAVRNDVWITGFTIGRDYTTYAQTADQAVSADPEQPATEQTWVWELRGVLNHTLVQRLLLPAGTPFNLQTVPYFAQQVNLGMVQWHCNDGQGFHPVGDPFNFAEGCE